MRDGTCKVDFVVWLLGSFTLMDPFPALCTLAAKDPQLTPSLKNCPLQKGTHLSQEGYAPT